MARDGGAGSAENAKENDDGAAITQLHEMLQQRDETLEALQLTLERKQEERDALYKSYSELHAQMLLLREAVQAKLGVKLAPAQEACAPASSLAGEERASAPASSSGASGEAAKPPGAPQAIADALQKRVSASAELGRSALAAVEREADTLLDRVGGKLQDGLARGLSDANAWSREVAERLQLPAARNAGSSSSRGESV